MKQLVGKEILNDPFMNKGTAFTYEERKKYELTGLLPTVVRTLEEQVRIEYEKVSQYETDYEKNKYLMQIYNMNRVLYYRLVEDHLVELMPIIYTPTIADAVMNFSRDYERPNEAVYLDTDHPEDISQALQNGAAGLDNIDLMVITDGEGVLGIGDWGIEGVMISVGKLAVYTAAGGMNPERVLPVIVDNGTNREELLKDAEYIGKKCTRKTGEEYYSFIEKLVQESEKLFPGVLFHWEDFGRGNAGTILERYRSRICTFNDDIQGTGVMMSAAMNAIARVTGTPVTEHRYVIFGGGTAGCGVADQILLEMTLQGMPQEEAIKHFYLVDRYGLVTDEMTDLTAGQVKYARRQSEFSTPLTELADIIEAVRPSVLIGTSGQPGKFTETVVRKMAEYNEKPAILPISNPTKLCEAKAEDVISWSEGRALVVTGSPSQPVTYQGTTYVIGQANNALLYPGLGLGIVVAKAKTVTDGMLSAAAHGIVSLQDLSKKGAPILPPVKYVREASRLVAKAVVKAAIQDGVATAQIADADIDTAVEAAVWTPTYR